MTINANELLRGGTIRLNRGASASLAEGTGDATCKFAVAVDFAIDGILYHKAITDNIAMTAQTEQALATTCLYLVTLTTGAAVAVVKGVEVANADLTSGKAVLRWPAPAVDTCPVGAIKVACGTTAFQLGTGGDDLTDDIGTGTVTYYDLCLVPASPMTS